MPTVMMECGHSANATCDGKPACAICSCYKIAESSPDLTGRKAKCPYCKKTVTSNTDLPFFEYRPGHECDSYYCGCRGWD